MLVELCVAEGISSSAIGGEGLCPRRGKELKYAMATCEGRVTEGSLREGAPAERVEEPAAERGGEVAPPRRI